MRKVWWILGGLAALALAGVVALFLLVDAEALKPRLIQTVQERYHRDLKIEGKVSLSLFPRLALALPAGTLSQRESSSPFASWQSARVGVALLPLLRGKVEIDVVRIDGLALSLTRRADGSFDDAPAAPGPVASPEPTPLATPQFEIGGIELRNARVVVRDLKDKKTWTISDLQFETGRIAALSASAFKLSARFASDSPRAEGSLEARGELGLDLLASRLSLGKFEARSTGCWGTQDYEFRLETPRAEFAEADNRADQIQASLKLASGAQHSSASIKLIDLRGASQALQAKIELSADTESQGRKTRLSLTSPVQANALAQTLDLSSITGQLSSQADARTIEAPIAGSARLDLASQSAAIKLESRLDLSPLSLQASILGWEAPRIEFKLTADKLDLDPWLTPAPRKTAAPSFISVAHAAPATHFAWLSNVKLGGEVKIGELKVQGLRASQLAASLRSEGGRLAASPLSASLYGGRFKGSAWLRSDAGAGTEGALSGIDLAALLRDLGGKGQIEGRAHANFDLTTRLADPSLWKRALAGRAAVKIEQGAIRGINLERILSAARRGQEGVQTQRSNEGDKTEFSELSASFSIDRGVARNSDLRALSAVLRITGEGDINLAEDRVDYLLRAALASSAQRTASLTVPVKVSGPFSDIHYSVDWGALAAEALKHELQRRLSPEGSSDAPIDALRKLFKR